MRSSDGSDGGRQSGPVVRLVLILIVTLLALTSSGCLADRKAMHDVRVTYCGPDPDDATFLLVRVVVHNSFDKQHQYDLEAQLYDASGKAVGYGASGHVSTIQPGEDGTGALIGDGHPFARHGRYHCKITRVDVWSNGFSEDPAPKPSK